MPVDLSQFEDKKPEIGVDLSQFKDAEPGLSELKIDFKKREKMSLEGQEERAAFGKELLDESWKMAQEIGSVYPVAETAATVVSTFYGLPISGLAGLISMPANIWFDDASKKVVEAIQDWLIYRPITKKGEEFAGRAFYPFIKLDQIGGQAGNATLEATNSPLWAAGVHALIAGAPAFLGLRGIGVRAMGKISSSTLWRRMTIRERGLTVQRLHEFVERTPEATEGQIIRHAQGLGIEVLKEKAISARRPRRRPPTEPPAKPPKGKPPEAKPPIDLDAELTTIQKDLQRPVTQAAVEQGIPVAREELLPFKGEPWADKALLEPESTLPDIPTDEEIDIFFEIEEQRIVGGEPEVEGEGIKVFHGTPQDFAEFVITDDIGFHFGTKEAAQTRLDEVHGGEGQILERRIIIKNPMKAKYDPGVWDNDAEVIKALPFTEEQLIEINKRVEGEGPTEALHQIKEYLKELGFDSVVYGNAFEGGTSYIVLDASQIKDISPTVTPKLPELPPDIPADEILPIAEEPVSFDFKEHVEGYVGSLLDQVKAGEAGKRLFIEKAAGEGGARDVIGFGSSFPEFMRDKGWTKTEVVTALDKGLKGERLGKRQEEIFQATLEEAQRVFLEDIERYMPEIYEKAEATIDAAITNLLGKGERMKATRKHLQDVRKALRPKPVKGAKKRIREVTGQTTLSNLIREDVALKAAMKKAAAAARKAFSEGKKEAVIKERMRIRLLKAEAQTRVAQRREFQEMVLKLRKVDTSKMSAVQKAPIDALLSNLDLVRLNKSKQFSLEKMRSFMEQNPDAEFTPRMLAGLERLEKARLEDLTLDELRGVFDSVMHHVKLENLKQNIRVKRRDENAQKTLIRSIHEMRPPPEVRGDLINVLPEKSGSNIKRYLTDAIYIRQLHYDLLVELIAGPRSMIFDVLYRQPKAGTIVELKYKQDAFNTFQKGIEDAGFFGKGKKIDDVDAWLNEEVRVGPYRMTRGMTLAMYRHNMNADNTRAITKGGFGQKFGDNPNEVLPMPLDLWLETIDKLSTEDKAFAGNHVTKIFTDQYKRMNEVHTEVMGYSLPPVEGVYYPKDVMPIKRGTDFEKESALDMLKTQRMRIGVSKGMTKERVGSIKPLYLNGLTYDVNKSVTRAAAYIGLEIPLRNATRLLYDKQGIFRQELEKRYGANTFREIEKALRDVAGDWQSYTSVEELFMRTKNKITPAMLGLNPFVMAIQPLSLPLAAVYVKSDYLMRGIIESIFNNKEVLARHRLYDPEFIERIEGGFSRDISDIAKAASERRVFGGKKPITERVMSGIQFGDKLAVVPIMEGAVLQALDEFTAGKLSKEIKEALDMDNADIAGLNPVEKMQKAYEFADWVIERTQPMFTKMQQSSLQRGVALEKLGTMFGSFTNQAFNLLVRTYMEQKTAGVQLQLLESNFNERARAESQKEQEWSEKMDAARKEKHESDAKFAKALIAIMVLNTLGIVAKEKVRDWLYDREGAPFLSTVLKSWTGLVFGVRDVAAPIIDGMLDEKWFGNDVSLPIHRPIQLTVDVPLSLGRAIFPKNKADREKQTKKFVDQSMELILMRYGLPYRTPKKIIKAVGEKLK